MTPVYEYRVDGWPLCPRCGADELFSGEIPAKPTDDLQCLACNWRGAVPVKSDHCRSHRAPDGHLGAVGE